MKTFRIAVAAVILAALTAASVPQAVKAQTSSTIILTGSFFAFFGLQGGRTGLVNSISPN